MILDILEMCSGQRMMTSYIRPGGLWRDVPQGFEEAVMQFVGKLPKRIAQYESMLTKNPLFLDRTRKIGVISAEQAVRWGVTGPMLRATGIPLDLRKAQPYSGYEQYEFDVPTAHNGDTYDRYLVRMEELRQSLRIVRQAVNKLPPGPVRSNHRKFVPPPRSELGHSMEAVIHHFKLWTEGFSAPKGAVYVAVEGPRGQLGCYLEGDGGPKPYRVHFRAPSFVYLQALPLLSRGHLVADLVGIVGSIDIVLGDCDR
jgi:NADH-quinone oxidoreductase subunit D